MTSSPAIRRVTAVLESGSHGSELLAAAAEIAARLQADVQAVLLQNTNLHRLAELGIARIISMFAPARPATPGDVVGMLGRFADQAEAALGASAEARGVAWSFRVLHGDALGDLFQAIGENELLVVDVGDRWSGRDARFGGSVWRAIEPHAASVLLIHRQLRQVSPAVLITEPSGVARHALAVGMELLPREQRRLDVLLATRPDDLTATATWIRQRHQVRITPIADCGIGTLTRAARGIGANLLVIPGDDPCLHRLEQIVELADRADCALLLLRGTHSARNC